MDTQRELILESDDTRLWFSFVNDDWTRVFVADRDTDARRTYVGSESFQHVASRLIALLANRREYDYDDCFDGRPCRTVVVLSDPHAILFASRGDHESQAFVFVDHAYRRAADFNLSAEEAQLWEERLRQWCAGLPHSES